MYPQKKFLEVPVYVLDENKWSVLETDANCLQEVKDEALWLEVAGGGVWTWSGVVSKKILDTSKVAIEVKAKEVSTDVYDVFPAISPDNTTAKTDDIQDWLAILGRSSTKSDILEERVDGTATILHDFGSYMAAGEWHIAKLMRNGNQVRAIIDDKDSGWVTTSVNFINAYLRLDLWTSDRKGGIYYDYIRVRKYTEPEPSVSLGEEETA